MALNDGGTVQAGDGRLEFKNCNSLTLLVAAGTDYALDYARHYRGEDPHAAIERRLAAAAAKKYDELKAAHIAEYQSCFNRVALDVGATPADRLALPIDRRKVLHAEKGGDPELEALLFQYGRYLLISCSRPGGLPANLQGLWNDSNDPPWHSDYHANINIQMNYWPAEPANLAECHTPLFDLIVSQLEPWRKATAAEKRFATASGKSRGWAVRTSHGINGDEGWQWDVHRQRVVLPALLDALRLRRRQDLAPQRRLPGDEGDLRILGSPAQSAARRPPRHPGRLVPGARPARRRRQLLPANRLGPVQQLRGRQRSARHGCRLPREDRRPARQAPRPARSASGASSRNG